MEPPITGVAGGSLGTAANLEDTQVMRTEDLRAAAAVASTDASAAMLGEADAPPDVEAALPIAPVVRSQAPAAVVTGRPRAPGRGRHMPALAGVLGIALFLAAGGVAFLSGLDLGLGTAGGATSPGFVAPSETSAIATPAPKQAGKADGHKGCHGRGHGNDCQGNED